MQRAFIVKEWERKTVMDSDLDKSVVEVAVGNVMRKRGQRPRQLWRRRRRASEGPGIPAEEFGSLKAVMAARPWVPWA